MNVYFQGALSVKHKYFEPSWVQDEVRCSECGRYFKKNIPDVNRAFEGKVFATAFSGEDLLLPGYNGYPVVSEKMCEVFKKFGDPILEIPAKIYISKKHNTPVTQVIESMRALYPLRSIDLDPLKSRKERILDCSECGATRWRISGKTFNYDFSGESIKPHFFSIHMYEAMPFYSEALANAISEEFGVNILDPDSKRAIGYWSE